MTKHAVKKLLKNITYKPEFKLRLDESDDIEISLTSRNADGRGENTAYAYVVRERYLQTSRSNVVLRVADAIWRLENHEYAEWFKYKGKRLYDPNH